jgi:hypothetical protein
MGHLTGSLRPGAGGDRSPSADLPPAGVLGAFHMPERFVE